MACRINKSISKDAINHELDRNLHNNLSERSDLTLVTVMIPRLLLSHVRQSNTRHFNQLCTWTMGEWVDRWASCRRKKRTRFLPFLSQATKRFGELYKLPLQVPPVRCFSSGTDHSLTLCAWPKLSNTNTRRHQKSPSESSKPSMLHSLQYALVQSRTGKSLWMLPVTGYNAIGCARWILSSSPYERFLEP